MNVIRNHETQNFISFNFFCICIFTTAVDEVVNNPVNFHNEIQNYKANFNFKQFSSVYNDNSI